MSDHDEGLRLVASHAIYILFDSGRVSTPITSMGLLTRVIASKAPTGLFPTSSTPPRFRLTDLARFESILETLSQSWDRGAITLSRDEEGLSVMDVTLGASAVPKPTGLEGLLPRKRKRVVDEDADSAAGDDDGDEQSFEDVLPRNSSTLATLSKELKEVYTILQKSTAKGRLLAEQVFLGVFLLIASSSNEFVKYHSAEEHFEPICPHITKDECSKARNLKLSESTPSSSTAAPVGICELIHFRPLLRPHTDPSLGHCSYLNTCYSEPTYAQSPSIPPFPGSVHSHGQAPPNSRGPVSLPSGLGAGGRGKEKAPCRYLHYEVDWDGGDGDRTRPNGKGRDLGKKSRTYKLGIGMGPDGKNMQVVRYIFFPVFHLFLTIGLNLYV